MGDLIFLVDLKPLPSSLIIVCQGGDRHHVPTVMDIVELSAMCFDWTHFDSKEKPPGIIFQPPGEAIYFGFLGMHFVNHSGDGKFMYLYGKFMLCY